MEREFSAGIVLLRTVRGKRRYLVLEYKSGHWDFPKGHIEKKESRIGAAVRETKEEVGIGVKQLAFVPNFIHELSFMYARGRKRFYKRAWFFLAESRTAHVKLGWEHKGLHALWLPYQEAVRKVTFRNAKDLLRSAEAHMCCYESNTFVKKVYGVIVHIPRGKTMTYGEVAKKAGRAHAARAVASLCAANKVWPLVPCHRVLGMHDIGGWSLRGGVAKKRKLLKKEKALLMYK